jgi:hypothetical protein
MCMEESNDTNLKPIVQILSFNKCINIWIVLVFCRDSWRKSLCGTSATVGLKVLNILLYCHVL